MFTRRLTVHLIASVVLLGVLATPSDAGASDKWIQIGKGAFADEGGHHESGRLAQLSWAWDNAQSKNVLWAGASRGGLWKSIINESGNLVRWVVVNDNFPPHTLGSFAVRAFDSNHIVLGTGSEWGNGDGIHYTTDAGSSWQAANQPSRPTKVHRIVADRSDGTFETLLAATTDGIWQSYDFGQHWISRTSGLNASDVVQDTGDPARWYAGVVNKGVYRSTDGGQTWAAYGTGITGSQKRISLAACDADYHYLYALVATQDKKLNGVYRSENRGQTWLKIYSDDSTINPGKQGLHTGAIVCDPADPAHIFVGMVNVGEITNALADPPVTLQTFDGGHADYNFMLFLPGDKTQLNIANDGGYYLYDIAAHTVNDTGNLLGLNNFELGGDRTGVSYTSLQGGLASSYSNPDVFIAGLQDDGLIRGNVSDDPAITILRGDTDSWHVSIMPDAPRVMGFVSDPAGKSRRLSYDGGDTSRSIEFNLGIEQSCAVLIDPTPGLSKPQVFTSDQSSGQFSEVYYTDTFSPGPSWKRVGPDKIPVAGRLSNVDVTVDPFNYEIVATVAGDDGIYAYIGGRDQLGSLPLSDISPPRPGIPTQRDARINADRSVYQPGTLYYTSGEGHYTVGKDQVRLAYVSIDGGFHWTDVTGDIATVSGNANLLKLVGNPASAGDPSRGQYFLATTKGVFRSDDGGAHWKDYSEGLRYHEQVDDIVINFDHVSGQPTLYIATFGRGFWRRTID